MKLILQKLFLPFVILFISFIAMGQEGRSSPEWEQMYTNAKRDLDHGNLEDAIVTYRQAIQLAPGNIILYKGLGKALYLNGKFKEAEQILTQLINETVTDEEFYRLLAASQTAQNETKSATVTLKKGLARFPGSGLLYHELGKQYNNKPGAALNALLDGILKEPGYPENYYEAARVYLSSDKVFWGLLYGEIFLYMEHDTTGDDELKRMLFKGYKTMYGNLSQDALPEYGKAANKSPATTFEDAVMQVYSLLTPVISDGITTGNLTMIRTRFLMDWFPAYGDKYPFSLFSYEDNLVRSGHFDICNQWMFGKAENAPQYEAWNNFHEGDVARFLKWKAANKLHPLSNDFYNNRNMDELFNKKNKKL